MLDLHIDSFNVSPQEAHLDRNPLPVQKNDDLFTLTSLDDLSLVLFVCPLHSTPPPRLAQVACSYSHTVVVTDDDRTWTFGGNDYGQLGHGDHSSRSAPAALACFQGLGVLSVACGVYHTVCCRETRFGMQGESERETEKEREKERDNERGGGSEGEQTRTPTQTDHGQP